MWLEYLQNGIYPSKGRLAVTLAVGKVNPAYSEVSYWLWIEIYLPWVSETCLAVSLHSVKSLSPLLAWPTPKYSTEIKKKLVVSRVTNVSPLCCHVVAPLQQPDMKGRIEAGPRLKKISESECYFVQLLC